MLVVPSADRTEPPFDGPYEAGGVWAVLDPGRRPGTARCNGRDLAVDFAGAHLLIEHDHHSAGELELQPGPGVRCDGICFTPGLAPGYGPVAGGQVPPG